MTAIIARRHLIQGAAATAAVSALPGPSSAQGQAKLERVNIVLTSASTNLVLTALMEQLGYMRELGLDPNFVTVADGNKVVAALISGAADVCPQAGFTQVLAAIARDAPLKMIGGSAIKNFNTVFTRNPNIRTLKDLEGKTVGVGALGTQLHQLMIALFRKYGVDSTKVRFANVGAGVNVFKAVQAGVVDAGPAEIWLGNGANVHIVEHGATFDSMPEFVNQAAFTSSRALAEKRPLIVKTMAAYARLFRFVQEGNAESAFMIAAAKAFGPNESELAKAQWQFYRAKKPFAEDLGLGPDRVKFMQELNVATGTQKVIVPYAQVADPTVARDALKLLG